MWKCFAVAGAKHAILLVDQKLRPISQEAGMSVSSRNGNFVQMER